jgi:hypothetical protein
MCTAHCGHVAVGLRVWRIWGRYGPAKRASHQHHIRLFRVHCCTLQAWNRGEHEPAASEQTDLESSQLAVPMDKPRGIRRTTTYTGLGKRHRVQDTSDD